MDAGQRSFLQRQIVSADAYAAVPRLGRKNRMGPKQRARLWPVFEATRTSLNKRGVRTWAQIFGEATAHFATRDRKPFTHIVVDETRWGWRRECDWDPKASVRRENRQMVADESSVR